MTQAFITKYRPKSLNEVIGQKAVVRALTESLARVSTHAFLFTGPSGTGKTTLARIAANQLGCAGVGLLEVNAANYTGVDDMRATAEEMQYLPLGGKSKGIIIDECHRLSRSSWDVLLKPIEEPGNASFWFFCTTEPTKVPANILTRCTRFDLRPVAFNELAAFLDTVAAQENICGGQVGEQIIDLCAREAGGSPRQALSNLAACAGVKTVAEAKELLRSAITTEEAVVLARALVRGAQWPEVQQILSGLGDTNPETIRHTVRAYVTKVVLGAKKERTAGHGLEILDAFSTPFVVADGISPVVLACGKVLLGG